VGRAAGDEGSAPGVSLHQSLFAKRLHRFANRGSAYAELVSEFPLRRQLITLFQVTLEDGVFNLLDNLLVQPRCLDYFVHDGLRPTAHKR
jgi:hypothetical protein